MHKFCLLDYLFILRPLILIPAWNFLLIGNYIARGQSGLTPELVLGFVIFTCIMGGTYILNQIMDRETDRINRKLFLLSEGYISVKAAYGEMICLWVVGLGLSFMVNNMFLLFVVISLVMGIMYSVRPFKLKGRPILDTLANGIGYGMVNFGVGWLLFRDFEWVMFYRFIPYFLSICAVFINTTVVDMQGDAKAHERTTALLLGERAATTLSTLIMLAAIIMSAVLRDIVCLIPAAVSLPLFLYVVFHTYSKGTVHRRMTIASFRLPGLLFTIIAAVLYPPYFAVLIIVFIGMRLYYKHRFNMIYPSLAGG
jgi:4-hydroxybenzoate polyprenyltransferase